MSVTKKVAFLATSALASSLLLSSVAFAQSTGSQTVEEVVVTAKKDANGGTIVAEQAPKSRSTITQEYLASQAPGQSLLQSVNMVPGVNFVNNDPYGSSGGNLRIRSFDGNRISLTWDGMPLNDTGNYAIYSNQLLDPELITKVQVNLGTTDVDSPTASATGGTVAFVTRKPYQEMTTTAVAGIGSFNERRGGVLFDTGAFGPFGTTAFIGASISKNDWWRGAGEIDKQQYNAKLYQGLGNNGDFMAVAFHWNRNRNASSRSLIRSDISTNYDTGWTDTCVLASHTKGVADNDGATGTNCGNFYGLAQNPSDTGNIRGQSSFHLAKNLRLTIDPSFQYVLATGGNESFTVSEKSGQLQGSQYVAAGSNNCLLRDGSVVHGFGSGTDVDGDGDCMDTARYYSPSVTNTRRYGLTSSLIWDLNDTNRFRFAYTLDYGMHRQTGEGTFIDANGFPTDVFGGKDGHGDKIYVGDGSGQFLRFRDRYSIASLNQVAAEYVGHWFNNKLDLNIGVRAPFFQRQLNNFCYTQDGTSTAYCTTEVATLLADGNYKFASQTGKEYIAPFHATKKYDAVLPNVGVNFHFDAENFVYASYAEGLSAPRTDSLYTLKRDTTSGQVVIPNADPETTQSIDIGFRHQGPRFLASAAVWHTSYHNRIVTAYDDTFGIFVDRNVGDVDVTGLDLEAGYKVSKAFNLYGSASYNDSVMQQDILLGLAKPGNLYYPVGAPLYLPTKGKHLVETPDWTFSARATYDIADFKFGLQGKYVGKRYTTDVNDDVASGYTLFDFDARYNVHAFGLKGTWVQFNVLNIFDTHYLGNISSKNNAVNINGVQTPAAPTFTPGSPRTVMLSVRTQF